MAMKSSEEQDKGIVPTMGVDWETAEVLQYVVQAARKVNNFGSRVLNRNKGSKCDNGKSERRK